VKTAPSHVIYFCQRGGSAGGEIGGGTWKRVASLLGLLVGPSQIGGCRSRRNQRFTPFTRGVGGLVKIPEGQAKSEAGISVELDWQERGGGGKDGGTVKLRFCFCCKICPKKETLADLQRLVWTLSREGRTRK